MSIKILHENGLWVYCTIILAFWLILKPMAIFELSIYSTLLEIEIS